MVGLTPAIVLCAKYFLCCFGYSDCIPTPTLYDPSVIEETLENDKGSIEMLPYHWLTYAFG